MDLQLPRLFGGNDRRGLERLEAGLRLGPNNAELKIALAEVYLKRNRQDDAKRLLESVISDTDPMRSPVEMRDLRSKARQMLERIE
jgi:predicted Zn-dependent protease